MEYLLDYLLFAAKLTTLALIVLVPLVLGMMAKRGRRASDLDISIERVNDSLEDMRLTLEASLLPARVFKQRLKQAKAARKARQAGAAAQGPPTRTFVCHFNGDLRATAVAGLRDEITAILSVATASDRVVVVLESGGGTIHGYGLAASQLSRVRERGIHLSVVVDRIAASGGYMMACVGEEIVAAPFAIVGSIGVIAQLPNFHRLLQRHAIDFEQVTAGEFKRTLTMFGENSPADRAKLQAEIDDAHALFKDFVARYRPHLDVQRVATGEWWFGTRALELGLVDRLATSDDVIGAAAAAGEVFRVRARRKRSLLARLTGKLESLAPAL